MLICGIDEAGRGAVIGPLVLAGIAIKESDNEKLEKINVKDSKLLTQEKRAELFTKILSIAVSYKIIIIQPPEIDIAVSRTELNWLEARHSAVIIDELSPDKAIIDCPTPNIILYKNYLAKLVAKGALLCPEHRADLNYPVVSAASIIAKVTRDKEIENIKNAIRIDFGSGYPSDPLTVDFLERNLKKHSEIFRKSWMTVKIFREKKIQKKLADF
jgi:ribonuclease HII